MKKILLVLAIALLLAGVMFAGEYTIQSITGTVEREVSPGKKVVLDTKKAIGEKISDATVLNVGVNSEITLLDATGKAVKITTGAGAVSKLASASRPTPTLGAKAKVSTEASARGTANINTGSQRASEAAGDIVIVE
jgi:hypothetical protein